MKTGPSQPIKVGKEIAGSSHNIWPVISVFLRRPIFTWAHIFWPSRRQGDKVFFNGHFAIETGIVCSFGFLKAGEPFWQLSKDWWQACGFWMRVELLRSNFSSRIDIYITKKLDCTTEIANTITTIWYSVPHSRQRPLSVRKGLPCPSEWSMSRMV